MAEARPEDLAQFGHVLATLQVRLTGDDGHHPHVPGIVGIGQGLDRLIQLLVRLRVRRDQGHVPELARIRDRLPERDQALQVALLAQQAFELAPAAVCRHLVPRRLKLLHADSNAFDDAGQVIQARLRVR